MYQIFVHLVLIITFVSSLIIPIPQAKAQPLLGMPEPGQMVYLSTAYNPIMIKGVTVHQENPFLFDFIVDPGQDKYQAEAFKKTSEKLVKYFLASLAIPDDDLWVNLSPYEKDRIVPNALGQTEMGRDLLAQDYMLKQITASLIYPEQGLGKEFWDKVYKQAREKYGNVQIPVNTFNKVWIMADRAKVFQHNNSAFVIDSHLKVMLEEDYLATQKNSSQPGDMLHRACPHASCQASKPLNAKATAYGVAPPQAVASQGTNLTQSITREIILPALEKEVNQGKNFANLRQIFNSIILSSWYKKTLKNALLNQVYANKEIIAGINLKDPQIKDKIYERYLQAYKKGVFNFIKEDNINGETIPRKYFSGGVTAAGAASQTNLIVTRDEGQAMTSPTMVGLDQAELVTVDINLNSTLSIDSAMQGTKLVAIPGTGELLDKSTVQRELIKLEEELDFAIEDEKAIGLEVDPKKVALNRACLQALLKMMSKMNVLNIRARSGVFIISKDSFQIIIRWAEGLRRDLEPMKKNQIVYLDTEGNIEQIKTRRGHRVTKAVIPETPRVEKKEQAALTQVYGTLMEYERLYRFYKEDKKMHRGALEFFIKTAKDKYLVRIINENIQLMSDLYHGVALPASANVEVFMRELKSMDFPRIENVEANEARARREYKINKEVNPKIKWDQIPWLELRKERILLAVELAVLRGQIIPPSAAMTANTDGGIDLKTSQMKWDIQGLGRLDVKFDQAQVAQYLREGIKSLSVRILNIEPINNIWAICGMQKPIGV